MKSNFIDAIYKLYPQVTTTLNDTAYDKDGNEVSYDAQAVQTYVENHAYKTARQYPSIGDQLDMLWHAIDTNSLNKTSDFYTAIKAVKDAHPKE
jgi:gamma-glutamylcysteine synthetase